MKTRSGKPKPLTVVSARITPELKKKIAARFPASAPTISDYLCQYLTATQELLLAPPEAQAKIIRLIVAAIKEGKLVQLSAP